MTEPSLEMRLSKFLATDQPRRGTYLNAMRSASGQAITMMVRQKRIILATLICFLPVAIPVMMVFFSSDPYAQEGLETFILLTTNVQIRVLCPLLALFFATMLIGQDVESQTIPFVLTRPIPRSAWIIGRYVAYLCITEIIMALSIFLTFGACTALEGLSLSGGDVKLALHFVGTAAMALIAYGALMMFLGAVSKRPIIIGVVIIYGWQPIANFIPGLIDFLTIKKFVDTLLPSLAEHLMVNKFDTAFGEFTKKAYDVSEIQAIVTLIAIAGVFTMLSVVTVRWRQYATSHAQGD
jgi:ABC-type transport system involved in multi-copper enzyme maturation permease subunit